MEKAQEYSRKWMYQQAPSSVQAFYPGKEFLSVTLNNTNRNKYHEVLS
jgi:hypothetical protein